MLKEYGFDLSEIAQRQARDQLTSTQAVGQLKKLKYQQHEKLLNKNNIHIEDTANKVISANVSQTTFGLNSPRSSIVSKKASPVKKLASPKKKRDAVGSYKIGNLLESHRHLKASPRQYKMKYRSTDKSRNLNMGSSNELLKS